MGLGWTWSLSRDECGVFCVLPLLLTKVSMQYVSSSEPIWNLAVAMIGSTLTLGYHKSEKSVCKGLYFSPAWEVVGPTSWGPFLVLNKEVANVAACKSFFPYWWLPCIIKWNPAGMERLASISKAPILAEAKENLLRVHCRECCQ